ncbi:hypothetical protein JYT28_00715 [Desulfobulbus sp. AH-315-M07]|nr:hypothetical protein [Desulfobulbus sp. AH-315-M07]
MRWLGRRLGFRKPDDWYRVTGADFNRSKGGTLLVKHGGSPLAVLRACFPEHEWLPWKFKQAPQGFWKKKDKRWDFMDWLGKELGFKRPQDWYTISVRDFEENHGKGLLIGVYKGSPSAAVMDHLPDFGWQAWRFANLPLNHWSRRAHRREYMDCLGRTLGYERPEDWYKLTAKQLQRNGGAELLKYFNSSPSSVVIDHMPKYEWQPWLFPAVPQGYWHKRKHRLKYMRWLGERLGYKRPEHWYKISVQDFEDNGGLGLLVSKYGGSPIEAVMNLVPRYSWKEWMFQHVPLKWWDSHENQRKYLRWLGKQLGYKKPADWYQITARDFAKNHGATLVSAKYGGSPSAVVIAYFPNRTWLPWMFNEVPRGFWAKAQHRRAYMNWLATRLGIRTPSDWYYVTGKDFEKNLGGGLFSGRYRSSVYRALRDLLPRHPWKREQFRDTWKRERRLAEAVRRLYPRLRVEAQYKHPKMRFKASGASMELDVFVPARNIGFEYQGEQHFIAIPFWGGEAALRQQQNRDQEKRRACKRLGIRLVEVHYSWDGTARSLRAILDG